MSFSASKNFKICFLRKPNTHEEKVSRCYLPFANPAFPLLGHPAGLTQSSTQGQLEVSYCPPRISGYTVFKVKSPVRIDLFLYLLQFHGTCECKPHLSPESEVLGASPGWQSQNWGIRHKNQSTRCLYNLPSRGLLVTWSMAKMSMKIILAF